MGLFQTRIYPPAEGTSFAGQTIIVTGASSGLGLEAVRQFVLLGAYKIILACRSIAKGEQCLEDMQADVDVKQSKTILEVVQLDLDDYQSVLTFVKHVKEKVNELDILLNNAGMNVLGYHSTKDGHERMIQGQNARLKRKHCK